MWYVIVAMVGFVGGLVVGMRHAAKLRRELRRVGGQIDGAIEE